MERNNFIEIDKILNQINDSFDRHTQAVSKSVNEYTNLATAVKNAMPSDLTKAYEQLQKSMQQTTQTSQTVVTVQQKQALEYAKVANSLVDMAEKYKGEIVSITKLTQQNERYRSSLQKVKAELALRRKELTSAGGSINHTDKQLTALIEKEKELTLAMRQNTIALNNQTKDMMASEGSMDQMSQRLGRLRMLFRSLSQEQRDSPMGAQLQKDIAGLDQALKGLDASIGNYQRNVGNYAKQWDGLRHETNQLIRELPAMAYGANIFFGAISNNLPMFLDQVKKARIEQKLAIEEGKQAPGVISRIAGALFNWQTALVLGLTYLTLHGREIWNWVKSLWSAVNALKEVESLMNSLNKSKINALSTTKNQIAEFDRYLSVLEKEGIKTKNAKTALDALRGSYSYWLGDLKDEQIAQLRGTKIYDQILDKLQKRNEFEEKRNVIENNQKTLDLLDAEIKKRNEVFNEQQKLQKIIDSSFVVAGRGTLVQTKEGKQAQKSLNELNSLEDKRLENLEQEEWRTAKTNQLVETRISLQEAQRMGLEHLNSLRGQSIELDYKEEKSKKNKKQATYSYLSALESEYDLKVLYFQKEIELNKELFGNEKKSYDERVSALEQMYKDQIKLSGIMRVEALRLLTIQNDNEKKLLDEAYKAKTISATEYESQLIVIRNRFDNQEAIINKTHVDRLADIEAEKRKELDKTLLALKEYNSLINAISEGQLTARAGELEALSKLKFGEASKGLEQYAKNMKELSDSQGMGVLLADIARIENEMVRMVEDGVDTQSEAYKKLNADLIALKVKEQEMNAETTRKAIEELAKLEQAYATFSNKFTNDVLKDFSSMTTLVSKEFQDMIKGLMDNGEFGKAGVAIALQITDAFQEMFNMMQTFSDAYYNNQYERLEMQKENALKFAGESATAREEIERQYNERKRAIEIDQAKRQKDNAVFNAIINVAQGITSALATGNIPLSILIGVLGAAQIAMIQAQPLPAFAEGGTHDGGMMLVNDAKGSNYKETVVTPDGKIMQPKGRNVVMNAPKGTQIFTPDQWSAQSQIANILMANNILPPKAEQGITKEDLREAFQNSQSNNGNGVEINVDKNGFNTMIKRNGQRIHKLDSRIRILNPRR